MQIPQHDINPSAFGARAKEGLPGRPLDADQKRENETRASKAMKDPRQNSHII